MFNKPDLEQQTLEYVNGLRRQYGHKELSQLPKAVKGNSRKCVIARALHDVHRNVSVSSATHIGDQFHLHPSYVAEFIGKFDRGAMPHLVGNTLKPDKLKYAQPKKAKPSLWSIIKDQFRTPQTEGINEQMKGIAAAHQRPEPTNKSTNEPSQQEKFLQQMALEQQEMDKKIELAEIELEKERVTAALEREKERTRQKELELELERERTIRATAAEDTKPLLVSDIVNA